jgi:polyhydroxyalkanoate synthesis regulator phasin
MYSLKAQVADEQLRMRCEALEKELQALRERVAKLETKPKRGRPRKDASAT